MEKYWRNKKQAGTPFLPFLKNQGKEEMVVTSNIFVVCYLKPIYQYLQQPIYLTRNLHLLLNG